jgi:hypothetical protein
MISFAPLLYLNTLLILHFLHVLGPLRLADFLTSAPPFLKSNLEKR